MTFGLRSTRGALIAAGLLFAVAIPGAASAQALNVEIDQSARIQLRGQAGSVIVGNPQIADVTVVDANTLFVTGKGYGVTEVVVVDGLGRTLFQSQIVVAGGDVGRVRVWRGAQVTEMACSASCAPTMRSPSAGPAAAPN
ncbi:MAG: pilus assembly protein N-terminal domain-containing protein [Alphaproteobacteria bacterium]|nr:pilus assembly protein N-terminal domain-containing protein [Alphaproteobacteria bacterium]MBU1527039.1 pilus assembly protein N-terminal domain-containing protein [Alphaproteobacteria bacterium]MBU2116418.1 pilus assembly protein N-terminal domain-containing protein [Alphaproteobacteria bacterium]MBU2352394.1 pilus assembly protein N-terminal domain-containing protein [Alphaproteobacteria bacterium]MBU2382154.1 pilus assembly protein N-terminal domain-containing protein [Alphaproteobacteria